MGDRLSEGLKKSTNLKGAVTNYHRGAATGEHQMQSVQHRSRPLSLLGSKATKTSSEAEVIQLVNKNRSVSIEDFEFSARERFTAMRMRFFALRKN